MAGRRHVPLSHRASPPLALHLEGAKAPGLTYAHRYILGYALGPRRLDASRVSSPWNLRALEPLAGRDVWDGHVDAGTA